MHPTHPKISRCESERIETKNDGKLFFIYCYEDRKFADKDIVRYFRHFHTFHIHKHTHTHKKPIHIHGNQVKLFKKYGACEWLKILRRYLVLSSLIFCRQFLFIFFMDYYVSFKSKCTAKFVIYWQSFDKKKKTIKKNGHIEHTYSVVEWFLCL